MSPAELKALNEYINEVLAKSWIRESQSSAGAFILFVLRKSGELCLCVNYHDLNTLIIKNQYLLSLISELLNCLSDSVVFQRLILEMSITEFEFTKTMSERLFFELDMIILNILFYLSVSPTLLLLFKCSSIMSYEI